ncbi:MAG: extracellular solute-binding protein [Bacteroidia bacterium]|nr:extracellular solute-binding protein [Bacteroidia bacterium]
MKKSVKTLTISSTALLVLAALAGCTPTNNDFNVDMSVDTRGVTIQFWTGFGTVINGVLEPMLERFTEETGIIVEYETKGGYDALQQAINLSATSASYPHIANGYPDHFAGYIASDIILRLDGFIENDKNIPAVRDEGTENEFAELPAFDIEDFYPSYMVENQTLEYDRDGNAYTLGIPFNKSTEVAVVNKTAFNLFTAIDSTVKIPETWDEVGTIGAKIKTIMTNNGYYGKVVGSDHIAYANAAAMPVGVTQVIDFTQVTADNFRLLSYDSQSNYFITGVRQWGGTYTEMDQQTRRGYVTFNNDETRAMMTKMRELFDDGYIGIPQTWEETQYCSGPFTLGKSLMNIGSSGGVVNAVPQGNAFQVDATPIPYANAAKKTVISQGTNLALFDKGTDAEKVAAWKLLKYLTQYKNGEFAAGTGYYPTGVSSFESEEYQEYYTNVFSSAGDKLKVAAAKVNSDVYNGEGTTWTKFIDPGFVGSSYIRQEVNFVMPELFYGNPRETVQGIIDYYYEVFRDYVRN